MGVAQIRIPEPCFGTKEKKQYQRLANSEAEKLLVVHSIRMEYSDYLDERGNVEGDFSKSVELGFWGIFRLPLPFEEGHGREAFHIVFGALLQDEIAPHGPSLEEMRKIAKRNRKLLRRKGLPWVITINTDEFANSNDILREEAFFHEIGHLHHFNEMFEEKGRIRYFSKDEKDIGESFAQEFSKRKMIESYGTEILDML